MCAFDTLFSKNVPHILENIFLSLDYKSLKTSLDVSKNWRMYLTSESFRRKGKSMFHDDILKDEKKLLLTAETGIFCDDDLRRLLSSGMVDANYIGRVRGEHIVYQNGRVIIEQFSSTPLCEAALRGRIEIVALLLKYGAKCDVEDKLGSTPLHLASSKGHTEVVKLLLEQGAKCNVEDQEGSTPLHLASSNGHTEVVKELLGRGAEPNSGQQWCTPLLFAAIYGHKDVTKMLLDGGADPKLTNEYGATPLSCARSAGHVDIVHILMEYTDYTLFRL